MKKNYIYLILLIVVTVVLTLTLSYIYKSKFKDYSYSYENFNRITSLEFDEYMMEHPETIIYISDMNSTINNKFEKKFTKKLEELNLLKNVIYIDKREINKTLQEKWLKEYSFEYDKNILPVIVVISDKKVIQVSVVDSESDVNDIINYEVFE